MSTSSTSSIFSGTSRFSTDLQSVITRAVNIAQLPVTQLQQQKLKLQDQSDALTQLQTTFSNLTNSISGLATATTKNAVTALSSDYTIAKPASSSAGQVGSYTLNITNLGSYSTALSKSGAAATDPSVGGYTSSTSLTLSVNGTNTTITTAGTSMQNVADAINKSNAGVSASIVNLGSTSSPSYRLSLQSTKLGAVTLGLSDGGTSLVDQGSTGTNATYTINGQPNGGISSDTRDVTIAPNTTVSLVATGTATITVSQSTGALTSSLLTFVSAFNSAVDGLDAQRGQGAGALSGDSTVPLLADTIRRVANYSFNGMSLSSLGVTFDKTGKLQFDSTVVAGLNQTDIQNASNFLGNATTANSFMKFATDTLTGLSDSTKGVIHNAISSLTASMTDEQARIDAGTQRVTDLQTRLQAQMAQADALIANLEQSVSYYTSLFQAYLGTNSNKNN